MNNGSWDFTEGGGLNAPVVMVGGEGSQLCFLMNTLLEHGAVAPAVHWTLTSTGICME